MLAGWLAGLGLSRDPEFSSLLLLPSLFIKKTDRFPPREDGRNRSSLVLSETVGGWRG